MRPLLAIVITAVILGGLYAYMRTRVYAVPSLQFQEQFAEETYALDLTLTFHADRDPFAFAPESQPTVLVRFRGEDVIRRMEPVEAGTPLRADAISDIVVGEDDHSGANEFYFEIMDGGGVPVARAVRLRIFRDGDVVTDETRWFEPGEAITGTVTLVVLKSDSSSTHEHVDSTT